MKIMKKLLLLTLLFISAISACKKDTSPTPQKVKNKLIGKWNLTKWGDENPLGSAEVFTNKTGTYEFLENGTLIIDAVQPPYEWTVVDATSFQVKDSYLYTIEQLDDTNLKLVYDNIKNGVAGKRHMYFTRIP